MWNISLTKADKRKCRELIHVGLERECEKYVREIQRLASKPIPQSELNEPYREENGFSVEGPWHKRYIALYKKTDSFDKHIAQRYDGMTGGHYLDGVLGLYCEGIISDDEIALLSDEPREFLLTYKKHIMEDEQVEKRGTPIMDSPSTSQSVRHFVYNDNEDVPADR